MSCEFESHSLHKSSLKFSGNVSNLRVRIRENDSIRTEAMVAQAESRGKVHFHYAEAPETIAADKNFQRNFYLRQ